MPATRLSDFERFPARRCMARSGLGGNFASSSRSFATGPQTCGLRLCDTGPAGSRKSPVLDRSADDDGKHRTGPRRSSGRPPAPRALTARGAGYCGQVPSRARAQRCPELAASSGQRADPRVEARHDLGARVDREQLLDVPLVLAPSGVELQQDQIGSLDDWKRLVADRRGAGEHCTPRARPSACPRSSRRAASRRSALHRTLYQSAERPPRRTV